MTASLTLPLLGVEILAVATAGLGRWLRGGLPPRSLGHFLEDGNQAARDHDPDHCQGGKPETIPVQRLCFAKGQQVYGQR